MNSLIEKIKTLPKWYSFGIVIIYSFLLAEYGATISSLTTLPDYLKDILNFISKLSYVSTILSGISIWVVMTLLFHLTALLLNGNAEFKNLLYMSGYLYLIPIVSILIAIIILDSIDVKSSPDILTAVLNNKNFKLAVRIVNYSFIPFYLFSVVFIYYLYKLKYLYAFLSVLIPLFLVWGTSQLFSLI